MRVVKQNLQREEQAVADVVRQIGRQVESAFAKIKRKPHPAKLCAAPVEYESKTA